MLNRSSSRILDIRGPTWNTISEIPLEILRSEGGFVICGGGFAKRGVRTNPPNPGPDLSWWFRASSRLVLAQVIGPILNKALQRNCE